VPRLLTAGINNNVITSILFIKMGGLAWVFFLVKTFKIWDFNRILYAKSFMNKLIEKEKLNI
jgi:hypothetical protein